MLELPPITWQMVLTGLAVFLSGVLVSYLARFLVARLLEFRSRSKSSVRVFSQLVQVVIIILVGAASMTVVFPSVKPVDVLGGITIISLAAGIAFQTVLGNMFAGIVILARDSFRVGDQIQVLGHQRTVAEMGLSHASMRTFDGRLVVIPKIGTAIVRMEFRFWSGARQLETRTAQDAVIQSVVEAFREHRVKSGDEVVTVKLVGGRDEESPLR